MELSHKVKSPTALSSAWYNSLKPAYFGSVELSDDELYGLNESMEEYCKCFDGNGECCTKTTASIAKQAFFDKAKASAEYGICDDIKFTVILPFKEMIIGLDYDEGKALDAYKTHTALCSQIEIVQSAYWKYVYAQSAVDDVQANLNNKPVKGDKVWGAKCTRIRMIQAGKELVSQYEELIKLAVNQAEMSKINEALYLDDVGQVLKKNKKEHIVMTVNSILSRMQVEEGWLVEQDGVQETLGDRYQSFVTGFVSYVQEAHLQSRGISGSEVDPIKNITNAFIQGLAVIPELDIIELYGALAQAKIQDSDVELAIQSFKGQIEALMDQPDSITTADLQKIQYKGIFLQSVLPSIDAEQLNKLKEESIDLQAIEQKIREANKELATKKEAASQPVSYSFSDIQAFLDGFSNAAEINDAKLENVPNDKTALGRLAEPYRNALDSHIRLTQGIKATEEEKKTTYEANTQKLLEGNISIAKVTNEIERLEQIIDEAAPQVADKQKALEAFEKESKETLADTKSSDHMKKAILVGTKSQKTTLESELKPLQEALEKNQNTLIEQKTQLSELTEAQNNFFKNAELQDANFGQNLKVLGSELQALQSRPIAELTGEDIQSLAKYLGVIDLLPASQNRIFQRLSDLPAARKKITELEAQANEISKRMNNDELLALNNEGAFVLKDNVVGDKEKSEITTQLKSNLVIARKVTLAVGQEMVNREEMATEALLNKTIEMFKANKGGLRLAEREISAFKSRESILGRKLEACKKEGGKSDNLYDLVGERMEKLAPPVTLSPAKMVNNPLVLKEELNIDSDTENEDSISLRDYESPDSSSEENDEVTEGDRLKVDDFDLVEYLYEDSPEDYVDQSRGRSLIINTQEEPIASNSVTESNVNGYAVINENREI